MEAAFCLRAATINVPTKSRLLLPTHHLPAARPSHLRRGVFSVSFSHDLPPPAKKDNAPRKVVRAAGAAMVVACAVGALYLSMSPRGWRTSPRWSLPAPPCALILTAVGGGGSAARSSSSISAAANMDGGPPESMGGGHPASMGGGLPASMGGGPPASMGAFPAAPGKNDSIDRVLKTPLLLEQMLLADLQLQRGAEKPWVVLLNHLFFNVIFDRSKQLELIDLLYQVVVKHDPAGLSRSPVSGPDWLLPEEKIEAALAFAQVYFDLKNYDKTREVMDQIPPDDFRKDARIPLLNAVTSMMQALELLLLSVGKNWDETKMQKLVTGAKEQWKIYKKLQEDGIHTIAPPHVTEINEKN